MSEIITVDKSNIESEHICCAISASKNNKDVSLKKVWMNNAFDDGLVFKKLNERGKVFIEYIPAENAWSPIENAEDYMFIDCFWVSGKFKGQGIANDLLEACIKDSKEKGKVGLVVVSSSKKQPFLSDPEYLKYKGFQVADTSEPHFELLYLPFQKDQNIPKIKSVAKDGKINDNGLVVNYSNQCPFTEKYVEKIQSVAEEKGIELKANKFLTKEDAQNAPIPFSTYSFFDDGAFVTTEIFSEKKFIKYLENI